MSLIFFIFLSFATVFIEPISIALLNVSFLFIVWGSITSTGLKLSGFIFALLSSLFLDVTMKNLLGTHLLILIIYYILLNLLGKLLPDDHFMMKSFKIFVSTFVTLFLSLIQSNSFHFSWMYLSKTILPSLIVTVSILIITSVISLFKSETNTSGFKLKI